MLKMVVSIAYKLHLSKVNLKASNTLKKRTAKGTQKKKRCNLVGIIFNAKLPGSSSNWGNGLGGKVKLFLIIE